MHVREPVEELQLFCQDCAFNKLTFYKNCYELIISAFMCFFLWIYITVQMMLTVLLSCVHRLMNKQKPNKRRWQMNSKFAR